MKRRVLALASGELLLAGAGLWAIASRQPPGVPAGSATLAVYALAVAGLALLPRMFIELRRHSFLLTPADLLMLVGLFIVGPWGFVGAGMLAECLAAMRHRQTALKTAFNFAHMLGGLVAAALTFTLLDQRDPLDPRAWLAGAAAIAAVTLWDLLSTAAVLAIAEGRSLRSTLTDIAPAAALGLVFASLLGIAALVLFVQTVFGPLLFAPVLAIVFISSRGIARQRAQRQHIERLYEASANLTQLVGLEDMLGTIATEARSLVTGAAALAYVVRPDGEVVGVLADDGGQRPATGTLLRALTRALGDGRSGELAAGDLSRTPCHALPPFRSLVWAAKTTHRSGRVVLAVLRELPQQDQAHRSDVLTAFVAQAAAVVDNVGLHEEVQQALDHQVALNRQKAEFVAAVSHELRTPLAAMLGSVQTAKRLADRVSEQERAKLFDMGLSQGARLQSLINDLLLVAAADHHDMTVQRTPIEVRALFEDLDRELADVVGDRLRIALVDADLVVRSDQDKLYRILVNLVDNARKYAPNGPIEVTAERRDDRVVLAVADHGPGIRPQDRERVFERFVQLDQSSTRRQGGTGLGLALCRELAGHLDGTLEVTDPPWVGGSRFVLDLPAAAGRVAKPVARPVGIARSPLRRPAGAGPARPPARRPRSADSSPAIAVPVTGSADPVRVATTSPVEGGRP